MSRPKLSDVQSDAILHAQHGVEQECGLDRLARQRDLAKVGEVRRVNSEASDLKAKLATGERLAAAAAATFKRFQLESGGAKPSLWWPTVGAVFAFLLAAGDGLLVAPLTQVFGIVEPWIQLAAALFISAGIVVIAHVGIDQFQAGNRLRAYLILGTVGVAIAAVAWGRCDQVLFQASLGNPTWQDFVATHALSTKVFFVLLTIPIPFAAGLLSAHNLPELRFAASWHKARKVFDSWQGKCDLLEGKLGELEVDGKLALQALESRHEVDRCDYVIHHKLARGPERVPNSEVAPHA